MRRETNEIDKGEKLWRSRAEINAAYAMYLSEIDPKKRNELRINVDLLARTLETQREVPTTNTASHEPSGTYTDRQLGKGITAGAATVSGIDRFTNWCAASPTQLSITKGAGFTVLWTWLCLLVVSRFGGVSGYVDLLMLASFLCGMYGVWSEYGGTFLQHNANHWETGSKKIPPDVKQAVWNRDKGKCVRCGSTRDLEYDHDIPVSKGGSAGTENVQILCRSCNRRKGAKIV